MAQYFTLAHADAPRRRAHPNWNDSSMGRPARPQTMERLSAWFNGAVALRREEAHGLLAEAVESGQLSQYRAEFVAAVKALALGPGKWPEMGYRLLPDD